MRSSGNQSPSGPRRPGAGAVEPVSAGPGGANPDRPGRPPREPAPEPPPPSPPADGTASYDVTARFATAAAALSFAEQVMGATGLGDVPCYRSAADRSWWVAARLRLGPAREMAGLGAAALYVRADGGHVRDRGWGEDHRSWPRASLPADLADAGLEDLIQAAGLHPAPVRPVSEVYALLPGYLVPGLLERALELRLLVTYQQVRLEPLFGAPGGGTRVCYAVRLAAADGQDVPAALLAALRDDPFTLVCRAVGQTLLIGYGSASPMSDRALADRVVAAGDTTWLLAAPPDGCARLTWSGEPLDAASLVRLGPAHALTDIDGAQPYAAESPGEARTPTARPLTLARSADRDYPVDAHLLDDDDLDSLPLLLAGDPLGDDALLIRGDGRHLLTAPGGLLRDLGLGEPLTCVGPGGIYVPAGYRLDPPVGPAVRAALFEPDNVTAQVVLRDRRLGYDLDSAEPAWRLWAGPPPRLDRQLSRAARSALEEIAAGIDRPEPPSPAGSKVKNEGGTRPGNRRDANPPGPQTPSGRRWWETVRNIASRGRGSRPDDQSARDLPRPGRGWRAEAYQAERGQEYAHAARLYERNGEPLRAARMWEREAGKYS